MKKLENGQLVDLTAEEVAEKQQLDQEQKTIQLNEYLIEYRYRKESGGYLYTDGNRYQTHRESRADWLGVLIQAQANPAYTVKWKHMGNEIITLDALTAVDIANKIAAHVAKCFAAEAVVKTNIGSYKSEQEIRDAFDAAYSAA